MIGLVIALFNLAYEACGNTLVTRKVLVQSAEHLNEWYVMGAIATLIFASVAYSMSKDGNWEPVLYGRSIVSLVLYPLARFLGIGATVRLSQYLRTNGQSILFVAGSYLLTTSLAKNGDANPARIILGVLFLAYASATRWKDIKNNKLS